MPNQLESTLVLTIRDTLRWESALDAPTSGTLSPLNPSAPLNPLDYQQRDRELSNRDIIIGAAIVDTSVQISDVYNYPALKPLLEGPVNKDLPFQAGEITSFGTASAVRHVDNSSIPWDASRFTDSDLYGRDALIYEILARACQAAFINPPITRIDQTGTIFPDVTAWSLGEGLAGRADINPALALNKSLFKLPDQNLADRDNVLATYVATLAQVLKNPFTKAMRIYVKVTGPGNDVREPEVFVLTSDNGVNRIWQSEPALSDRNRIIYNFTNKTLQWIRESVDEVMVPQIYAMTIPGIDLGQLITTLAEIPEAKDAQFWRLKAGQIVPAGEEVHNTASYLNFTASSAVDGGTMQIDSASLTAPGQATFTLNGSLSSGVYRVNVLTVPSPHVEIAGATNISSTSGTLGGATFEINVASGAITTKQYIVVGGDGIGYNGNGYAAGQIFSGVAGVTTYTQISANASSVRQYAVNFQLPLTPGAWTVKLDYTDLSGVSDGFGIKAQYIATGANAVTVIQDAVAQPFEGNVGEITTTPLAGFDVNNTGAFSFPVFWTYGTGQLHVRKLTFESKTTTGHYQMQGGFAGSTAVVDVIGTAFQPDVMRFEFQSAGTVNPEFSINWVGEPQMPIKFKQIDIQTVGTFTPTPVSSEFAGWRQECMDRAERVIQQTYAEAIQSYGTAVPTFRDSGSRWSPLATEGWMSFAETTHPRLRELPNIDATLGITPGRQYQVTAGPVLYGTNSYNVGQRFYGDASIGTSFSGGAVKQVGAFIKSLPGHIGRPALIPYGLTYSGNGTVTSYYDTPHSTPMVVSCVPWMIDQGVYVAQDDFWMSDFLVVQTQSRTTVVTPPAPPAPPSEVFTFLPEPSSDVSSTLPSISDPPVGGAIFGSTFFLLTQTGLVFTSTDGLHWTDVGSNANTFGLTYTEMAYGEGVFVAFSTSVGNFAASTDGITWVQVQPSGGAGGGLSKLLSGAVFNGILYLIDDDQSLFKSTNWESSDGTLYSAVSVGSVTKLATNGTNLFVGVGTFGFIFYSADAVTWNEASDGAFLTTWTGVAYGNGVFVAVGSDPRLITSTDGNNWTTQSTVIDQDLVSVCFGNGFFIALSASKAWKSTDGVTWTLFSTTLPGTDLFTTALYMGQLTFLGYEQSVPPPSVVLVPTESTGWSGVQTVFGWAEVSGVLYGLGDSTFYSSTDGSAFSTVSTHGIISPTSLTYGLGLFVAGSENSFNKKTWSSPDGITWTSHLAGSMPVFVAFGNSIFVAIGDGINVTVSPDGLTWTNQAVLPSTNPRGIAFGAGLFISASAGGLASSPDGVTWTTRDANNWRSVAFVDSKFVAVGSGGIISTSPDGITWTSQTSGTGNDLASTGGGGGAMLAVSAFGVTNVYQSVDGGITWTFLKHETNDDFPSSIIYFSTANVIDAGFFV